MDPTERPVIYALIALDALPDMLIVRKSLVTLEQAVEAKRLGWAVLIDPESEHALATWEREHRWAGWLRRHDDS